MKKFIRIMAVLTVLAMLLSVSVVASYAVEFEDYYTAPSCVFGDADNNYEINVKDATIVQKYLAKLAEISDDVLEYADVNASGDVTISDATLIQKYVACIIEWFPAEENFDITELVIGESMEVEFSREESFMAEFTVEEEGFYNITATPATDCSLSYLVSAIVDNGNVWYSVIDGESAYCYGFFAEGTYRLLMYADDDECDVKASLIVEQADESLFDINDAEELKAGDRIELKADGSLKVFKVDNLVLRENEDVYYIYTEGENTQVNITVYSEVYAVIGESEIFDESGNVEAVVMDDYINNLSFVVVECYESGEDFTLCCESATQAYKDKAEDVSVGTACEIEIELIEGSTEDEFESFGMGSALYCFTPETSGYYSIEYSFDGFLEVIHSIEDFDYVEGVEMIFSRQSFDGKIKDVRYFDAGVSAYIAVIVGTKTDGVVEFEIGNSTEEEYNQVRLEDEELFPEEEASPDEIEYEEISLNQTVEVELSIPGKEYKGFKFTAEEDCKVVVYSAGSSDAYIDIYDSEDMFIYSGDDAYGFDTYDFVVKGTLAKGETCYFLLGTYSEDVDSYTFSIVMAEDYKPEG